jgi:hypothetical protein
MHDFLPNSPDVDISDLSYFTACYLALPTSTTSKGDQVALNQSMLGRCRNHMAFRQTVNPVSLIITEQQLSRFTKATKQLRIQPCFHLSELEPHIAHPIKDEVLAAICSCRASDCPGECTDIHSWDRPFCLEEVLKEKSKGKGSLNTMTSHRSC